MTAPSSSDRLAETSRVEAFSDGVLAIALTLLVLDLRAPDGRGHFAHALLDQWQSYVAFLAAFLNISAIWVNHHDLFSRVRGVDARLMSANLLILLVASLFPFPAAVISSSMRSGSTSDQLAAILLYALVGFLLPLAWLIVYGYLARTPRLLVDDSEVVYIRRSSRRAVLGAAVYAVAAALAFIEPLISLVAFVVLPMFFIATVIWPEPPVRVTS